MSRGTQIVLAYAPQTNIATVPTTGFKILPRKSDSLNHKVDLTASETIVDSRIATAGLPTQATVEGDVECELIKGAYDDLLEAAAGNAWANNVLTFGGNVQKLFAIEKAARDISQYHLFSGLRVNSFRLNIPENGMIDATFGFVGAGYGNKTTSYANTAAATPTAPKASTLSIGDIKINGSTMKGVACVTAFSFELNNNIERQNCLGGGMYASNLLEMMADMTGSMTLAYSQKSQEILNNQITGAAISIEVLINFADGTSYTLTIPKAQVAGDIPSGGREKLDAQLTYTVVDVAPTLTRTVAA